MVEQPKFCAFQEREVYSHDCAECDLGSPCQGIPSRLMLNRQAPAQSAPRASPDRVRSNHNSKPCDDGGFRHHGVGAEGESQNAKPARPTSWPHYPSTSRESAKVGVSSGRARQVPAGKRAVGSSASFRQPWTSPAAPCAQGVRDE